MSTRARLLRPIVQLRDGESTTALLMFLYSFLAMTSYNIIKPITAVRVHLQPRRRRPAVGARSRMGVPIGVIMQGYTKADLAGAAPLDDPGHAGRHRGAAAPVLVPVHVRRRRLGRGRVLHRRRRSWRSC